MPRVGKKTLTRARTLRSTPTDAERKLWSILRGNQLGHRFRRQHPVGPYILDFACLEARLAIEADGGQHAGNAHDARRDAYLGERGWRVLRLWNNDILENLEGVRTVICSALLSEGGRA